MAPAYSTVYPCDTAQLRNDSGAVMVVVVDAVYCDPKDNVAGRSLSTTAVNTYDDAVPNPGPLHVYCSVPVDASAAGALSMPATRIDATAPAMEPASLLALALLLLLFFRLLPDTMCSPWYDAATSR
jgi:hypothetical protein